MDINVTLKSATQCALIGGVTSMEGRALLQELTSKSTNDVPFIFGISRRTSPELQEFVSDRVQLAQLDLLDGASIESFKNQHQSSLQKITVAYYVVYKEYGDELKNTELNSQLFKRWLDLVIQVCPKLKHVNLQTSIMYYGADVAPFKTPACEFDPRTSKQNYYHVQEDYLKQVCSGRNISYTILRPSDVIGYAPGKKMLLGGTIAVYATLCKVLGRKLIFPGPVEYWNAVVTNCDSNLLARGHVYLSLVNEASNKAFNISNGDVFRWKYLWPVIAAYFGVEYDGPQTDPHDSSKHLTLTNILNSMDAQGQWNRIATDNGLVVTNLSELITPGFVDLLFSRKWDVFADIVTSRIMGFKEFICTELSYIRLFDMMKERNYIPKTLPTTTLKYSTNVKDVEKMFGTISDVELGAIKLFGVSEGARVAAGGGPSVPISIAKEE
jgi:nucleoside-diphosphate-sugar epimerase